MDEKIIIQCEDMTEEDINELQHQIAVKISPYGATMWKNDRKQDMKEREIGSILMSAKGLRRLADSMDIIYPQQLIKLPLWKFQKSIYFQLKEGTGAIDLRGDEIKW